MAGRIPTVETLIIAVGNTVVVDANGGYLQNLGGTSPSAASLDLEGSTLVSFLEEEPNHCRWRRCFDNRRHRGSDDDCPRNGTILFGETDGSGGASDRRTGLADQDSGSRQHAHLICRHFKVLGAGTDSTGGA